MVMNGIAFVTALDAIKYQINLNEICCGNITLTIPDNHIEGTSRAYVLRYAHRERDQS